MRKSITIFVLLSAIQTAFGQRVIHSNIGVFGNSLKNNNNYIVSFSSILGKSENTGSNIKSILIRPFNFNSPNFNRNNIHIEVFPNPSSDIFNIKCDLENISFKLFSMSGTIIKSGNTNSIIVKDVTPGVYIIQIYSNSSFKLSQKVIIQK